MQTPLARLEKAPGLPSVSILAGQRPPSLAVP